MSMRYPNANYPTAYDEDNMVKTTDVPVNEEGGQLTVTEAADGYGPLLELTGADVKGVSAHDIIPVDEPEAALVAEVDGDE